MTFSRLSELYGTLFTHVAILPSCRVEKKLCVVLCVLLSSQWVGLDKTTSPPGSSELSLRFLDEKQFSVYCSYFLTLGLRDFKYRLGSPCMSLFSSGSWFCECKLSTIPSVFSSFLIRTVSQYLRFRFCSILC